MHREIHTVIRKAWVLLKTWIDLDHLEKTVTTEHNYGWSKMYMSAKGTSKTSVAGGPYRQIASTLGLHLARPSPCPFISSKHLVSKCKYLLGISLVIYESYFSLFFLKKRIYWQKINRMHLIEWKRSVQVCWTTVLEITALLSVMLTMRSPVTKAQLTLSDAYISLSSQIHTISCVASPFYTGLLFFIWHRPHLYLRALLKNLWGFQIVFYGRVEGQILQYRNIL